MKQIPHSPARQTIKVNHDSSSVGKMSYEKDGKYLNQQILSGNQTNHTRWAGNNKYMSQTKLTEKIIYLHQHQERYVMVSYMTYMHQE